MVSVPDPRLSEVPVAFVVPRAGQTPEPEELMTFCRGRIAGFKVPRHFFVASELPNDREREGPALSAPSPGAGTDGGAPGTSEAVTAGAGLPCPRGPEGQGR